MIAPRYALLPKRTRGRRNPVHFRITQERAGGILPPGPARTHAPFEIPDGTVATPLRPSWFAVFRAERPILQQTFGGFLHAAR